MSASRPFALLPSLLLGLSVILFGLLLFKHVSYPLLWQDEGTTAMFGVHVLSYGYPKVHGERVAVYPTSLPTEQGIAETSDAYRGAPWGSYYVSALAELVARGADDPWSRTGRLRGVFALLGSAGLALLLFSLLPLMGGVSERRLAAAAYWLLTAFSISFLLHLREVGPLAPSWLLLGAILYQVLRLERVRSEGGPSPGAAGHALKIVPLLFLLGATSTLAALAVLVTLLFCGLARALRRADGALSHDLLPLLLAALALYPLIGFLGPEGLRWDLLRLQMETEAGYGAALWEVVLHLLRYEWLAPVVLGRLAVRLLGRVGGGAPAGQAARVAAADLLSLLVIVYVVVLGALPVFFERHAVLLSPLLIAILVLDARSLLAWISAQTGGLRRSGVACASGLGIAVLVVAVLHGPEIAGRFHEVMNRYQGPLDHLVRYVRDHYEEPSGLSIATNNEGAAVGYYLGSIVLVDTFPTRLRQDYFFHPDVILPRPSGRSQRHLGQLAVRSSYDQEDLPVMNLLANNVPTLSPRDASGHVHRFETADLPEGTAGVPVLELPRPDAEAEPVEPPA